MTKLDRPLVVTRHTCWFQVVSKSASKVVLRHNLYCVKKVTCVFTLGWFHFAQQEVARVPYGEEDFRTQLESHSSFQDHVWNSNIPRPITDGTIPMDDKDAKA
jgi:hypothetical protein